MDTLPLVGSCQESKEALNTYRVGLTLQFVQYLLTGNATDHISNHEHLLEFMRIRVGARTEGETCEGTSRVIGGAGGDRFNASPGGEVQALRAIQGVEGGLRNHATRILHFGAVAVGVVAVAEVTVLEDAPEAIIGVRYIRRLTTDGGQATFAEGFSLPVESVSVLPELYPPIER
jgi:hypothetical protein